MAATFALGTAALCLLAQTSAPPAVSASASAHGVAFYQAGPDPLSGGWDRPLKARVQQHEIRGARREQRERA